MKILATMIVMALSVTGCSGISFNSNIGPYASSRVKEAIVKEYMPEEIAKYDAVSLGIVEASYCQNRVDEQKPSKFHLVRDLKVRTHNLGGNGLVLEACGETTYSTCLAYMECKGWAYSVPQRRTMP